MILNLLVKCVESLDCPNEKLVSGELVSKAIQARHLALFVTLILCKQCCAQAGKR